MTEPSAGAPPVLPPTDDLDEVERRLASTSLLEAMTTQRAVRRVLPDPVDERIVRRLVEVALEAPTGSNGQNWEFVVVTEQATKEALGRQYARAWKVYGGLGRRMRTDEQTRRILRSVEWQVEHFTEIPVLVVCCLRGGANLPFLPVPSIAASSHYGSVYPSVQNLLLAARAVGLGGSLITLPLWSATVARRLLGLPFTVEPCCVVPLGWAKGRYGPKARKPVDEVLHRGRYGETLT
ncbi:MAG: nitroreductase family protein [Actinobacteria bacterium]|nr:nitroreductase family protein [Actinomycetota bacterium]